MPASNLKKELLAYIKDTDDEDLLSLLKEDFIFYGKVKNIDITDGLNGSQLKELKALSEEGETTSDQTLAEFKKATRQWRTK